MISLTQTIRAIGSHQSPVTSKTSDWGLGTGDWGPVLRAEPRSALWQ